MDSTPPPGPRRMQVFLCHSSTDKPAVRELDRRLREDKFEPWLDEKKLIPGQDWKEAIEAAVRASDAVVVCLSPGSVRREGPLQREIRIALDAADEKPEGTIFVIPARLSPVNIPSRLARWHWVNLYEGGGYELLVSALNQRAKGIDIPPLPIVSTPSDASAQQPKTSPDSRTLPAELRRWLRSNRMILISIAVSLLVVAGVLTYVSQAKQHARRADLNRQFSEQMRSFNYHNAEFLMGPAAGADPGYARFRSNLAVTFADRGNYEQALAQAQLALPLVHWWNKKDSAWANGVYAEMKWDLAAAAVAYKRGWKEFADSEAGLRLAGVQTLARDIKGALATISELRQVPALQGDPRIEYQEAFALYAAAGPTSSYDDIVNRLDKIAKESKDKLVKAIALSQQCWVLYRLKKFDPAWEACAKAREMLADKGDELWRARTLTRQSLILVERPDKDKETTAMKLQTQALAIARDVDVQSQIDQAGALQNRANLWELPKDFDSARDDFDEAAKIYKAMDNRQGLVGLGNNKAALATEICKFEDAYAGFQTALTAYTDLHNEEGIALANSNIGSMLYFLGNLHDAESSLKTALTNAKRIGFAQDTTNWLITLGDVYMAQGRFPDAEQCFRGENCYDDTRSSHIDAAHDPVLPDASPDYALLQIETGHARDAEIAMQERLSTGDLDNDDRAITLDVLAHALVAQGGRANLNRARDSIELAQTFKKASCQTKLSLNITSARISAHLGQYDLALGKLVNAKDQADENKMIGFTLEILLAQAETDSLKGQWDAAGRQVDSLRQIPQTAKYTVVAQKAEKLKREIEAAQNRKGS